MDTGVLMSQISTLPDYLKDEVADFVGYLQQKLIQNKLETTKETKLSEIKGIGADLWKNIDVEKFIETEREW